MPLRLHRVCTAAIRHHSALLCQGKIDHHVLPHASAEVILFPSFNELPVCDPSSQNLFLSSIGIMSLSRSRDMSVEHVLKIRYEDVPCMMIVEDLISMVDVGRCLDIRGRAPGSGYKRIASTVGTSVYVAK
jgi:hypothetical protein